MRQTVRRPRTRLFFLLSVLWLIVSAPASFPFLDGWPESFTEVEWLAIILIAPHPIFILLALFFSFNRTPCIVRDYRPNLDYEYRQTLLIRGSTVPRFAIFNFHLHFSIPTPHLRILNRRCNTMHTV